VADSGQNENFWKRHPILEKVVGGLVLAAIVSLVVYFVPHGWTTIFEFCKRFFSGLWKFLTFSVSIPLWVFVLVLFSIGLLWFVVREVYNAMRGRRDEALSVTQDLDEPSESLPTPRPARPKVFDYKHDNIFGVNWIWGYYLNQISSESLGAFCPNEHCQRRLEEKDDINRWYGGGYGGVMPVTLHCPRCGFSKSFDEDRQKLYYNVCAEIERRINTGEYIKAIRT